MDSNAQDWYAHIADAVTALRMDFKRMSANRLPPKQFGIRVKSHPDTLIVTALNKMRSSREVVHQVSFSAWGGETPFLPKEPRSNEQNVKRVARFVHDEGVPKQVKNRYVWKKIPKKRIAAFLSELNISNMNVPFLPDTEEGDRPLFRFIEKNSYAALDHWDVCLPQGQGEISVPGIVVQLSDGSTGRVRCRKRQFERPKKVVPYLQLNKQRVGDISDERVEMEESQIESADLAWKKEVEADPKKGESTPGYMYRRYRSTPLLTIHLIECTEPNEKKPDEMLTIDEVGTAPMVAISLSFPDFDPLSKGERVVYRLNQVALRDLFGDEHEDENDTD